MSSTNSTGFGGEKPYFGSPQSKPSLDLLKPLRNKLDNFVIRKSQTAHLIAKLIPAQCPFERTIKLFGHAIIHIPPLCKLNPLYDEFVGLRFRALCFLVDTCGEDITSYC
ncbi:Mo-dependent nitrogenase C-terminal domain-containing protein [Pseudanabaena sp. FACHB-1998]|uniref:Mo-dependent nitrogenase C-terminal domain-containing protein n=1 Tax=Pseudanabaena sp. FACHB-1998 TaxID=2692858 RepID=UPI001680FB14|nr:Mo-dependent nitrogenase C-terminal domain-containing protein [Pseudanabaena sp. FACHB-1998]MBD2177623.1 Mo-dependent nitrogenase C-terminal domain-containing protein [Pseudanabaena sp. FACHB-1998]